MRVMIIRAGALGDTLMLMPSIVRLKDSTEITVLGRHPGIDYLRPHVNQCMDFEGSGLHGLFMERPGMERGIFLPDADIAAAFLTDPEGMVMRNLKHLLPGAKRHIFPPLPPPEEQIHVALHMARCLEAAGLPINAAQAIKVAFERPLFPKRYQSPEKGGVVMHPGSGSMKKNLPPGFWLDLIKALRGAFQERPEKITLLLGPAEENLIKIFRDGLNEGTGEVIFSPEKDELILQLCRARLYIGHDSGVTHLAAMHGTPVIALFRGSSVHQWGPLGPFVRIIGAEKAGSDLIGDVVKEGVELLTNTAFLSIK